MSRLVEMHEALGARWVDETRALPRTYGDPAAEYDAARNEVVVTDRADRHFVRVHGRDPVKMVQGLITNDIANAAENRAVYAAVLTPKGKMVADMRVLRHGADLLLELDAAAADGVVAHLRKFVPPLFARFEDATETWAELGVYGPRAREAVEQAFGIAVDDQIAEGDIVAADPAMIVATSQLDVPGFDIIVPAGSVNDAWQRLIDAGARPAGHATIDVLRIEAGRPRWGVDLDENTIPLEAGLRERAISETKGCYTGQEVIVRILHRGHVNWLLRGVLLGDTAAPSRGAELLNPADLKKVGRITSAAWSPKLGQTIALGYIRREIEPDAELHFESAGGPLVRVVELPFGM